MLEYDVVACPVCHKELSVKFVKQKKITYIVEKDCSHCNTPADKLESMLNKSIGGKSFRVERSYLKVDPRG